MPRNIPESTFTEVSPCSSVCGGSAVFGIKPEKYRKDRSLIYIKNPASGNLEGFFENELCEHLSDEVQEIRSEITDDRRTEYSGNTALGAGEFEILEFPAKNRLYNGGY
ncbi:MAG: hypothetical protein ACLR56_12725 [Oscillospiraceae bacterium]